MRVALAGFKEAIDLAASVKGVGIGIGVFARSGSSLLIAILLKLLKNIIWTLWIFQIFTPSRKSADQRARAKLRKVLAKTNEKNRLKTNSIPTNPHQKYNIDL